MQSDDDEIKQMIIDVLQLEDVTPADIDAMRLCLSTDSDWILSTLSNSGLPSTSVMGLRCRPNRMIRAGTSHPCARLDL